jgi:membrane-associated protein
MELIATINIWDLIFHTKDFLGDLVNTYHVWVYLILLGILFCETGLVVTPVLPGDSLLFITGYFVFKGNLVLGWAGAGEATLVWTVGILCLGPIFGDTVNYWIGRFVGPKIFHKEKVRFLNKEYLNRAHAFYEKHGGKAVAIGRFLPIIRTFVPFVAGIGKMPYARFLAFSIGGTIAWINLCVLAGYFFGGMIPDKHFELVVIAIIVISLIPAFVAFIRNRKTTRSTTKEQTPAKPQEMVSQNSTKK